MDSAGDLPEGRGFPIRTSADQRSLASPRGFSQRATSFIASWRQGIHRTPFSHSPSPHTQRPHAGPNRAPDRRVCSNNQPYAHSTHNPPGHPPKDRYTFSQIRLSKIKPAADHRSPAEGLLEAAASGHDVPMQASPMPDRPKAARDGIERGERSRTIRLVVIS